MPGQAVKLITAGKLENYLLGREPCATLRIERHGRQRGGSARPAIGVLKITARAAFREELNRKLLDMAKDRGLKSAYYVETLGGALLPRLLTASMLTASASWCGAPCSTISISARCVPA